MSTPAAYTLINPQNGHLACKVLPFDHNSHFDHIQRLNYYSALLVTGGAGRLTADFSDFSFTAGNLIFFAPYQPFMLQTPDAIEGVALHFHPDFFCIHQHQKEVACHGVLFNNIYASPILKLTPEESAAFLSIIDNIKKELSDPGLAQRELLVAYLKVFLIKATRLRTDQPPVTTDNRKTHILRDLKDAIENHYRTKHSAGDYSEILHISPKSLGRITKTHFNKTLTSLISERIIIEAKRELYLTSKTVKEIAWLLGFEDEYYFSRFFKNNADVSPQLFRETVGSARGEDGTPSLAGT
jgi:AraC family transcriptional regulator, transcriptional activator of pobA